MHHQEKKAGGQGTGSHPGINRSFVYGHPCNGFVRIYHILTFGKITLNHLY